MIEAVFAFALVTAIAELVLLCMLKPRTRLRLLGNPTACHVVHILFLVCNLVLHWGTVVGSMTGVTAFITSILVMNLAKKAFGYIADSQYHVGVIRYAHKELA